MQCKDKSLGARARFVSVRASPRDRAIAWSTLLLQRADSPRMMKDTFHAACKNGIPPNRIADERFGGVGGILPGAWLLGLAVVSKRSSLLLS